MTQLHRTRSTARGFTLIEALIALLVLSFGMLAIAGFQVTLSRSSDLAKQRTEAMRLAQQKMETLRSYGKVATDPPTTTTPPYTHKFNYTDDVVSSTAPEVTTTNATFSRTWTVTPNTGDTEKWINVTVAWNDRTGQAQNVQLNSVISKFDPQSVGTLATGAGTSNVRKPKNRNINIPYPAVTLSGGTKSAFIPPPGNVAYIFDNNTGNIEQSCTDLTATVPASMSIASWSSNGATPATVTVTTALSHPFVAGSKVTLAGTGVAALNGTFTVLTTPAPTTSTFAVALPSPPTPSPGSGGTATLYATLLVEGLDLSSSVATCSTLNAYLLSGYVRFDTGNNPTGEEPGTVGNNNATLPLDATMPLTLTASNQLTTNGTPLMTCYSQRQQVVTANSITAKTITGLSLGAGGTVTVTAAAHGFSAGQTVAITASSSPAYSGAFVIASSPAPTANTFAYIVPPPVPITSPTGGGTVRLVQRLTVQDDGTTPTGYSSTPVAKFISYACIVTPVDHDLVASTQKRWWGKVTLNANSNAANGTVWNIGSDTVSTNYQVCRFSADYNGKHGISNSEHPLWYRGVTGPLDNQNYLVVKGEACPTERPATPTTSNSKVDFSDDTTANHQPTGELSFQCATGPNCGGKAVRENSDIAVDIPME